MRWYSSLILHESRRSFAPIQHKDALDPSVVICTFQRSIWLRGLLFCYVK